jgi:deoxyuridine 5'-triphosphate nucleotidohydrolase
MTTEQLETDFKNLQVQGKQIEDELKEITNFKKSLFQAKTFLNKNYIYYPGMQKLSFLFPDENCANIFVNGLVNIKYNRDNNNISFEGVNIIDILGFLYPVNKQLDEDYDNLYKILLELTGSKIISTNEHYTTYNQTIKNLIFIREDPNSIIPTKAHYSDAGYDLTIIKKVKDVGDKISMYDTGISLNIPLGYYVEIHPRSSLAKSGYILSNNTGIIDVSYVGSLFITLTRVDDSIPKFELPFKCCQLILKKMEYCHLVEGLKKDKKETARGSGGFGSSDKKE